MSEGQLNEIARDRTLTMAERTAVKHVRQLLKKGLAGCAWQATKEAWDRDEGKAAQRVELTTPEVLSPEECEEIREIQRKMMETNAH